MIASMAEVQLKAIKSIKWSTLRSGLIGAVDDGLFEGVFEMIELWVNTKVAERDKDKN